MIYLVDCLRETLKLKGQLPKSSDHGKRSTVICTEQLAVVQYLTVFWKVVRDSAWYSRSAAASAPLMVKVWASPRLTHHI